MGILWAGRDETETAQGFLETAESIYQRYMKEVRLLSCVTVEAAVVPIDWLMTEQERLQQMKTVTHKCNEQGYRQTICHQGDFQNEHVIVSQLIHDLDKLHYA